MDNEIHQVSSGDVVSKKPYWVWRIENAKEVWYTDSFPRLLEDAKKVIADRWKNIDYPIHAYLISESEDGVWRYELVYYPWLEGDEQWVLMRFGPKLWSKEFYKLMAKVIAASIAIGIGLYTLSLWIAKIAGTKP